ncbi:MAG TPA: VTT domain-containing protein [Anaerolineales bacterium]|nr:VTT domain-containing protein [Anaerolineales bacterium]
MISNTNPGSQTGLQRALKRISAFLRSLLTPERRTTLARIMALFVVIGLSIFIFTLRDQAEQLAIYGYPGIFVLSFMAYATVLLPAPGVAVVFTMGSIFNPLGVALAAGTGAALGELSGYLAGFSGQAVVERVEVYERLTRWMKKNGSLTVFLLAVIPNPFFDLAGLAAGSLKMPVVRFFIFCWMGEVVKMGIFAFAGASALKILF